MATKSTFVRRHPTKCCHELKHALHFYLGPLIECAGQVVCQDIQVETNAIGRRLFFFFFSRVGPQAYPLPSNLSAPVKPATKTYDELGVAMTKLKSTVIAERFNKC